MDSALYMQGYLDGMKVKDVIVDRATSRRVNDEGPVY